MEDSDLRFKIGQRLAVGIATPYISDSFIRLVRNYKIANVILFRRNVESRTQLSGLCRDIQRLVKEETGHGAFILMDEEGGTVTRLPEDMDAMPGAMALASSGEPRNAYLAGLAMGEELRLVGVNFDLAPVMDVNTNPDNPVIGVRSFGSTPEIVTAYGLEMIKGLTDAGVISCAKHFPGHGDTSVDSHLALPCVDKPYRLLAGTELAPFKAAVDAGIPAIMTTHILFPQLEKEKVPATMSRAIITGLLKNRLGFRGMVVSDCLEMKAIQSYYGVAKGAVSAVRAGVEIVLISHTASLAAQAAEALEAAYRHGELDKGELDAAVEKILRYKADYADSPEPGEKQADFGGFKKTAEDLMQKTITFVSGPQNRLPALGGAPLFLGCDACRPSIAAGDVRQGLNAAVFLSQMLGGSAIATPQDPGGEEIGAILPKTAGRSCLVLGTYNGRKNKGQLRLANALAATGIPTVVIALHDPYDLGELDRRIYALAAFEYTPASFRAIAAVLSGRQRAGGRLSVTL